MIELAAHRLWLGNRQEMQDWTTLHEAEIDALVDLAGNEPSLAPPRDFLYFRFPLSDDDSNPAWLVNLTHQTVLSLLDQQVNTMIACGVGKSRTPVMAVAAIAKRTKKPFDSVLKDLSREMPLDVSPALWNQVRALLSS